MAWKFGNNILAGVHGRVPSIITELMEAVYERRIACNWDKAGDGHPFWYTYSSDLWNPGNGSAYLPDTSKVPPNNEDENQFRKSHINVCRFVAPGHSGSAISTPYHGMARDYGFDDNSLSSEPDVLLERFINTHDTYMRPYSDGAQTTDGQRFDIWKDALGDSHSTEEYTCSPLGDYDDATPHAPQPQHINQIRRIVEEMSTMWIQFYYRQNYSRTGTGVSYVSHAAAWATAKTNCLAASWGTSSGQYHCGYKTVKTDLWDTSVHKYTSTITQYKSTVKFNFDFDIDGNAKINWSIFNPSIFKMYGAGYRSWRVSSVGKTGEATVYTYHDEDYQDICFKVSTLTGTSLIQRESESEHDLIRNTGERGYYLGEISVGNLDDATAEFNLSTLDDYSGDEIDDVEPDDPPATEEHATKWTNTTNAIYVNLHGSTYTSSGSMDAGSNAAGIVYAVIKPNWKWGL